MLICCRGRKTRFRAFWAVSENIFRSTTIDQKIFNLFIKKIANHVCYRVCYNFYVFFKIVLLSHKINEKPQNLAVFRLELLTGFEPVTSSLPRTCSTC